MSLQTDLEALRRQPGAHLDTLRLVDEVFKAHGGERVTLAKGQNRAQRLTQARAVVAPGTSRAETVRRVMGALGVSRSTAYRYWEHVCCDDQETQASARTGRQITKPTKA